jgi:hypothetical protein
LKPTLFIQANPRQMLGARIAAYSARRNSARPHSFDVRILKIADYPRLTERGQSILRGGVITPWDPADLQSFSPLRFAPPAVMGFAGRALVTDPDCFAIGDVAALFDRPMNGKAIMAVKRPGEGARPSYVASSVMLLDCACLRHWQFDNLLDALFAGRFDYLDWMALKLELAGTIGALEPEWNDFDRLTADTKILHTTRRRTQPWKTGLPVDFVARPRRRLRFLGDLGRKRYRPHPDPQQEALIYSLLAEMLDAGELGRNELVSEMAANHIRHDSLELVERHRDRWPSVGVA